MMPNKIWTWCKTCMSNQDHIHDGKNWICQGCNQKNPWVRIKIAVNNVGEKYLKENKDE